MICTEIAVVHSQSRQPAGFLFFLEGGGGGGGTGKNRLVTTASYPLHTKRFWLITTLIPNRSALEAGVGY